MDYKCLGKNVRKYRKKAKLTQEALAEKVERSNSHIGQIENGRGIPSLSTTVDIANVLGITVDQLVNSDLRHPELTYLKGFDERLQRMPIPVRRTACQMIQELVDVMEKLS